MSALTDKTILISGGASGIGAASARMARQRGANVVLTDLTTEAGEALARELGERALFVRHDVTSEPDWIAAVETTV
ncbi:MAG: SDR family NAD(P)-dependent oxidoreductase, partial [Reyranellaceae bacterium]